MEDGNDDLEKKINIYIYMYAKKWDQSSHKGEKNSRNKDRKSRNKQKQKGGKDKKEEGIEALRNSNIGRTLQKRRKGKGNTKKWKQR